MADLFDRLFPGPGSGIEKIPVHAFHAAIIDYMANETTRNQIVAVWSMDSEAQTDLDALLSAVDALSGLDEKLRFAGEMDAVNKLAEADLKYTTKSEYKTRLNL